MIDCGDSRTDELDSRTLRRLQIQSEIQAALLDHRRTDETALAALLSDAPWPNAVLVGDVPNAALVSWQDRRGGTVAILRSYRRHYLNRHPELRAHESSIIHAIRSPDATFRYPRDETVANLAYGIGDGYSVFVSVQLPFIAGEEYAFVRSARIQRQSETVRWAKLGRLVWRK